MVEITILVVDADNKPVKDAELKVDTVKLPEKTSVDGTVMLQGDFILGESIMIEAIKPGFLPMDPQKYEVTLAPNEAKVTFKPTPGNITNDQTFVLGSYGSLFSIRKDSKFIIYQRIGSFELYLEICSYE